MTRSRSRRTSSSLCFNIRPKTHRCNALLKTELVVPAEHIFRVFFIDNIFELEACCISDIMQDGKDGLTLPFRHTPITGPC